MAQNNIHKTGISAAYKDDVAGSVTIPSVVIGIVKDNIDATRSGRIRVYINGRGDSSDPNNSRSWFTVKYMSPWFGIVGDIYNGPDRTGYGKYIGNPHSYGFWASAPDIGTKVLCLFVNGDTQDGFYIGCIPEPGLTHMLPAIGASDRVIMNESEAESYGGADRLPTVEVNNTNPAIRLNPEIFDVNKPVHSYQAAVLFKQGLVKDNLRGVISSTAQRETPSRVFGISTPGGPVYSGGFTASDIKQAFNTATDEQLKIVGRTGGHTVVMDDGTLDGKDQLIRIRTSAGHMIMMNDSGGCLTIIHGNGQSWIELGKEGTIDMYSTNSVNIRTNGDLNLHADRDINIHAKRELNMYAENIKTESDANHTQRVGKNYSGYTIGKHTLKVDQEMSFASNGDSSVLSKGINYINGRYVHLNTGASGTIPAIVPIIRKINHVDTIYSQTKGWMFPSSNPLLSVTSRAPAHMPWAAAGKGVDVSVNNEAGSPPTPTAAVATANATAPQVPPTPTTPSLAATAPGVSPVRNGSSEILPSSTTQTLVSQQAVDSAKASAQERAQTIPVGVAGATVSQLSAPGQSMKPGSDALVKALHAKAPGLPLDKIASPVVTTGANGIKGFTGLVSNVQAQVAAVTGSLGTAAKSLISLGVTTGKEVATQVSGVIMAAAKYGSKLVKDVLSAPAAVGSSISGAVTGIRNAISGGNYAAKLADTVSNGLKGVAKSLGGLLSSAGSGIASLISSVQGIARSAFETAEKAFKTLPANVPVSLGGATDTVGIQESLFAVTALQENIEQAKKDVDIAKSNYRITGDQTALAALNVAMAKLASLEQQRAQAAGSITQSANPTGETVNTASSSANSGVNALPGGIGAFVNQVTAGVGNIVTSVKGAVTAAGNNALASAKSLAGNIVGGIERAVSSISSSVSAATNPVDALARGAGSAIAAIRGGVAGITSQLSSAFGSFGNAPGQIKQAILAVNTFTTSASVAVKAASLIGNSIVPPITTPTQTSADTTTPPSEKQLQRREAFADAIDAANALLAANNELSNKLQQLGESAATSPEIQALEQKIKQLQIERDRTQDIFNRLYNA